MRPTLRVLALAALALALAAPVASGEALERIASDDRGVTFRLDLPAWRLASDSVTHRSRIVAPGLDERVEPGRPALPTAATLVALPQGARGIVTIVEQSDEEVFERTALAIGGRPGWQDDEGHLGLQPTLEDAPAILDGVWPRVAVESGDAFTLRRQRMMSVRITPFRYDESTGRLYARRSITVRVSFSGGTGRSPAPLVDEEERADPIFEDALINPGQSRAWRSARARARPAALAVTDPAGAQAAGAFGFDEDQPEVRVLVDSTGVLGMVFEDLQAQGYPGGVPVAEVSVHRHEYREGTTPPYATIEVPCEVQDGDGDGFFGPGDVILVYAQSWYDRARPSLWQRTWGDADYLYATRLARPGLRVPTRAGWRGVPGLTPTPSYPQTIHYEHDSGDYHEYFSVLPDTSTDPYHWVPVLPYYTRADTFLFAANHIDPSHPVNIVTQIIGRNSDGRYVFASVRNAASVRTMVFDSVFTFGTATLTQPATIPASALSEGVNRLAFWGRRYDRAPDPISNPNTIAALNWYEVTLWRAYRALDGYLSCSSADAAGYVQVRADGFTTNAIEVWDVTDSTAAVRLDVDPSHLVLSAGRWSIEFQDSVVTGQPRRYVVFEQPRWAPSTAHSPVTRHHLTEGAVDHDYLLVVPEAWMTSVAPLVAARQAQGLRVLVAPYEGIRDEFNGGRPSAHAVKRFIRFAYSNWGTRYVTLMGDAGGTDPRNRYGASSREWIPTMMLQSPVFVSFGTGGGFETQPSDAWYGWCVDPACVAVTAPKLHDVFVGRLPVNSAAEAAAVSAKLAVYDIVSGAQTWRNEMVLLADDLYSGTGFGDLGAPTYCRQSIEAVFSALSRQARDVVRIESGLTQSNVDVFDLQQYLASEPFVLSGSDTCRPDRGATQARTRGSVTPVLLSKLNLGRLWWNYHGHANEGVMTHESLYYTRGTGGDWTSFANDDKPFLFTAFSCHANGFTRPWENVLSEGPCVGEEMVVQPRRGAIASWASSGFEYIPSSYTSHISVDLARALFSAVPPDTSIRLRAAGDPYAHPVLGDAIALALMKNFRRTSGQEGISYELLGDPATRITIGKPQTTVLANGLAVTSGDPIRLHTPGDTVRFDVDLVSNQALGVLRVQRDSAGTGAVTVPASAYTITPAFPDTARGGSGGRRYHITYRTTLTPESYEFIFHAEDRGDTVAADFHAALPFRKFLLREGVEIRDGDVVPPTARMAMLVFSPGPLVDPVGSLRLRVNGHDQPVSVDPNVGDTSNREFVLSWNHEAYPVDVYIVELLLDGVSMGSLRFSVTVTAGQLRLTNAMLFPNPFEDEAGACFSFNLESGAPADVLVRVFTASGRVIYRRFETALQPGPQQLRWDGRDAEGAKLANGVYFYRIEASSGGARALHEGRMVKLRRPRRVEPTTP